MRWLIGTTLAGYPFKRLPEAVVLVGPCRVGNWLPNTLHKFWTHSNYPCWGDLKWISSGGKGVVKLWAMPIIFDMFPSQGFEVWLDWILNKWPFLEFCWSQSAQSNISRRFSFLISTTNVLAFCLSASFSIMCKIYLWRKGRKGLGSMCWGDLNRRN